MSTPVNTSSTDSQMHNNIMAAGSKDRPPMLGPGRYSQWRSRFLRYIDTKANGEYLRKCIFDGPYKLTSVVIEAVAGHSKMLQQYQKHERSRDNNYYQAPKPQRTNATSSSTRPSASTRHKGKEIAKPVTPQSESVSEEDSDPEQAQRDKDMQKNLALLAKYFKKLYKPTNNNLRTSSNSRNKTEDTTPRYNNDNQSGQFGNQRTMTVAGARETVGSQEVLPEESSSTDQPLEQVQNHDENNVFANERRHSEQPESINDTYVLEKDDSNVPPDSSNISIKEKHTHPMTQELKECRTNLDETSRALGEATSCRDSCLITLQNKQNEFDKDKAFNDRTIDYDILQTKLNETLGLLALKDIEIKEGQLKEKSKVISDLKVKEGRDIDKMIEMDKQIKFLNEILYKRNQSIQTIHMLAPKCATYNGRSTFANPKYLKIAQSEKPCLYEIPYDTSDPANRFCPNREDTVTLEKESRSKLNKDTVKPYDYTYQNSLYEIFKPPSKTYLGSVQNALKKVIGRQCDKNILLVTKPNIAKNVPFYPSFRNPTAHDMEFIDKIILMPLSIKPRNDRLLFCS
ncbi:hypothetical protein Tco_1361760 [Tanacetum coccineum]